MNKSIRLILVSASIVTVSQAAPFMAIGDSAELFATGTVGVRADDNIYLQKNATSDTVFDLAPGLELDFGKNSQTQGSLAIKDDFSLYTSHSKLNTNLFSGDFVTKYDDGKTKMGAYAGYHELNQNTLDIRSQGTLIRRDISTAGANGEVDVSELTAVGGAVDYSHENYHPTGYVDSDTITVPLNFYYKWTPKLDLSLGYQYRNYSAKSGAAPDSNDNFFSVGARGQFTPKLTGKFAIGYTQRRFSGSSGQLASSSNPSLLGLDASFSFELTPKSTLQLGATNDFGTSPVGQQEKNFTVNAVVTTKISEEWAINAGLSYRGISYYNSPDATQNRSDDYWEGTVGAQYVVSANLQIVGAYTYRNYAVGNSALSGSEFTNNVFSIAANFRY